MCWWVQNQYLPKNETLFYFGPEYLLLPPLYPLLLGLVHNYCKHCVDIIINRVEQEMEINDHFILPYIIERDQCLLLFKYVICDLLI